jgi:N-acetylglucosamine kinase-like BadF-type ATPase
MLTALTMWAEDTFGAGVIFDHGILDWHVERDADPKKQVLICKLEFKRLVDMLDEKSKKAREEWTKEETVAKWRQQLEAIAGDHKSMRIISTAAKEIRSSGAEIKNKSGGLDYRHAGAVAFNYKFSLAIEKRQERPK